MPTYGWVSDTEADTYFSTRLGASTYWASGTEKAAALTTAYRDLADSAKYSFPDTATEAMKIAQYEQALFRLMFGDGIERRLGLQTLRIVETQIIKERSVEFNRKDQMEFPICIKAQQLLESFEAPGRGQRVVELERNERNAL